MKLYKIADSYFEIIGDELMDNCSAYKIKVNRCISPRLPSYSFKEEKFFDIAIGAKNKAEEISEEEFVKALERITEESWTEVYHIENKNKGDAFILPTLACSAREAYIKTKGLSRQEFMGWYWELREKLDGR